MRAFRLWRLFAIGAILAILSTGIPGVQDTLLQWRDKSEPLKYQVSIYTDISIRYLQGIVGEAETTVNVNGEPVDIDTTDNFALTHGQSLSGEQIDKILAEYNSTAVGVGNYAVEIGSKHNIDAAYWLAMFIHESGAGANPNWAGIKGNGQTTHNTGNVICLSGEKCFGRFKDYNSWQEGTEAHIELLAYYRDTLGHKDIKQAINTWAPVGDGDNDPNSYGNTVTRMVSDWRKVNETPVKIAEVEQHTEITEHTHPVTERMHVNANFDYADCTFWGSQPGCKHLGTDYALVEMEPVYAPISGYYLTTGEYAEDDPYYRRGEYVMYKTANGYEMYFGHLKQSIRKEVGAIINAGDIIGYGRGDLAHTHVQVRNPNGEIIDFEKFIQGKE